MIDCCCFGWRKKWKKYEQFNGNGQSPRTTTTLSSPNLDPEAGALRNDVETEESNRRSPVTKDAIVGHDKARVFNYRELATATRNFHPDAFLGEGGFGSVYKGKLLSTNEVVAVKKLNPTGLQGEKEFLVEVLMLSLLRHPNLVNMIGYCAEGTQRLLVLEFMPLGSLEAHLHDLPPDQEPLDWNTRMKIAAGAAKGVHHLHSEANPPVIFRDLKPSNILLDEGFHPKLSDFGLAKFGPVGDNSHVSTRVMGTHGYCAPEYALTGRLTTKSDTYSFGVVLLELITGRKAVDVNATGRRTALVDWARPLLKDQKNYLQLVDHQLNGQYPKSDLYKAVKVAAMCLRENANARPTMHDVVEAMDFITSGKKDRPRSASVGNILTELKPLEAAKILSHDVDREKALAEAKMWGKEKRRQSAGGGSDGVSSWVRKVHNEI